MDVWLFVRGDGCCFEDLVKPVSYFGLDDSSNDNVKFKNYRKATVATWKVSNQMRVAVVTLLADGVNEAKKITVMFNKDDSDIGYRKALKWIEKEARASGSLGVKVWGGRLYPIGEYCDNDFIYAVPSPYSYEDDDAIHKTSDEAKADRVAAKDLYHNIDWTCYYTDGSASGEPSSIFTPWGASGWVREDTDNPRFGVSIYGSLDNNQLEMIAIFNVLIEHDKTCKSEKYVQIFSDSKVAIDRFRKMLRGDHSAADSLPDIQVDKILEISEKYHIELTWVKGHDTNIWHNTIDAVVGVARKMVTINTPKRRGQLIRKFRNYEWEYLVGHMKWIMEENGLTPKP